MSVKPSNPNKPLKSQLNFEEKRADKIGTGITDFFGSLGFLGFFIAFLIFWMGWNLGTGHPDRVFDKFPFPALEMVVSVFAIVLSISVLISQRRQGRQQRINQQVEFEVNVRAEDEITKILQMLHQIQSRLGIENRDEELENMKQSLDITELHQKLDEAEKE